MFTAHSSHNIKDFLLTIWNSVLLLKIQEMLVWLLLKKKKKKTAGKAGKRRI